MNTLHNLSGGIDSVYVAYKWLKEHPQEKLLLHHCSLRTHEMRWGKEDEAVKKVLAYFNDKGLTNYEYIETTLDIQKIRPKMWDSSLLATMTAFIMRAYPDIKFLLNNTPKDEHIRLSGGALTQMFQRASIIRNAITQQPIKIIPVLDHMMKSEIIKDMPEELLDLCWYCRTPKGDDVCGSCHTCLQVKPHLKIKEIKHENNNESSEPRSRGRKRKETTDNIQN